jgi:hypothetical protein
MQDFMAAERSTNQCARPMCAHARLSYVEYNLRLQVGAVPAPLLRGCLDVCKQNHSQSDIYFDTGYIRSRCC